MVSTTPSRLDALRRLPRDPESFYAISDMGTALRMGAVLWVFGAVIIGILLPVWPPTGRIGDGGWAVGAGIIALCLGSAAVLVRWPQRVSTDALLSMSFLAVALLTLLVWVGGTPYSELYVIPVIYAAAVHPPRRVAVVLLAVAAGLFAPLVYDGWNSILAADSVARLLLWFTLGFVAMLFSATVKLGRLELMAEEQEASELARRDPLTGLGNRRAFDEALARVIGGGRRSDRPLSLVIADIEGFKGVNDTYGHLEGDRCLREVAAAIAATLRPSDRCFRWGGDEFAMILPSTGHDEAWAVVSRVADAVAIDVEPPGDAPMRLRYGVAEATQDTKGQELVAAADLALMSARSAG